jgi:spore coat polysaccharide biosynthesis predicted glycosyltransferase SpsG
LALEITVVLGANNPHGASVQEAAGRSFHSVRVLVNASNMPELMSQSDLAVSAGGGTCYELAYMEVPMFLIILAQNQEETVKAFSESNAAVSGGWFDSLKRKALAASLLGVMGDQELRKNLGEKASRMVDGRGAGRVVEAMREIEENEVRG